MPVAWLSLDQSDNLAEHFLTYLIATLQSADSQIGSDAAQLMAGIQHASPEAVLTSLINDLESIAKEMVLVLDDYQYISNPTVHEQVTFLLEHCPRAFHLLIATRSDPPLPLARLRKKDRETQRKELLKLYGVGPATVWYLLFDVFHRWDFFDHVSPWEQKIYSKLFFDQDPEHPVEVRKILKHFERFGDHKQLAVHYVWEDLWWERKDGQAPWLEKLIRV